MSYGISLDEKDPMQFAIGIQQAFNGRSNAVGLVTLKSGATSTTVNPTDPTNPGAQNVSAASKIFLFPTTADAAAALSTTYIAPGNVTKQQFIITHANNAQSDRTFFYVSLG